MGNATICLPDTDVCALNGEIRVESVASVSSSAGFATPPLLLVASPNGQHACAGVFELDMSFRPNGYPLWKNVSRGIGNRRFIYSSVDGNWNIGGRKAEASEFQCHTAHIFSSRKHNGAKPHHLRGGWWRLSGGSFFIDPSISVSDIDRSVAREFIKREGSPVVFGESVANAEYGTCSARSYPPLPEESCVESTASTITADLQMPGMAGNPCHAAYSHRKNARTRSVMFTQRSTLTRGPKQHLCVPDRDNDDVLSDTPSMLTGVWSDLRTSDSQSMLQDVCSDPHTTQRLEQVAQRLLEWQETPSFIERHVRN